MKYLNYCFVAGSLLLLPLVLCSCTTTTPQKATDSGQVQATTQPIATAQPVTTPAMQASLPVSYQMPSYVVDKDQTENLSIAEESKLKVGAKITSTRGPQPLVDIIKRLAALKDMNVSWASDVDKNVLVDVNIGANDDFYDALDNMLRQVDYYHEMQGSTIIVKYKETKQFHIAMPFIRQAYKTNTGGDVLGGSGGAESNTNVAGEISLSTEGVSVNQHKDGKPGEKEFDTWNSIENNLNAILNIWSTEEIDTTSIKGTGQEQSKGNVSAESNGVSQKNTNNNEQLASATFRRSSGGNSYFIDKPVGLITVTAPRPLIEKLEGYFKSLKKELYKQIAIEAKIVEVQLDNHSAVGLDWNMILQNLSVSAGSLSGGKSYSKVSSFNSSEIPSAATIISDGLTRGYSSTVSLAAFTFDSFLHAVDEQGTANILSNPKLSVLNGQPALMTVGRNVTYIDKITSDTDGTTGTVTYTAETARALSGVGLALTANILDDNEIILNLVPVTSELVEPIEYRTIGLGEVGLPIINVREMSTTVKVRNGDMLVIGGLISSLSENDGTFVPGTNKIPLFKYLFGYEEKTKTKRELIILLKPRII